ncbi:MAG: response regulator, partial [Polyangiaceae bacterium]|nr:response regulator [Polyangiaceae bacterium]
DEDKKKERERESYVQALPGKRILLADDDPDLRALLAASLRRAGYAVLTGASGREVLNLFSSASLRAIPAPDVIVLDIRMPTHSGLELLVALRLAEWDVPVILITGFGDEITHARAKEFGAFELLDKPLRSAALLDAIKRALATNSSGKLNHD